MTQKITKTGSFTADLSALRQRQSAAEVMAEFQ
jgi:hypothetical protein